MDRRKQLGWAYLLGVLAIIAVSLTATPDTIVAIILFTVAVVSVLSCRYAVLDLHLEGYFKWFLISLLLPYVPLILLLERPLAPCQFSPDMMVGEKEPDSYGLGELTQYYTPPMGSYLSWKIASVILAGVLSPIAMIPVLGQGELSGLVAIIIPFVSFVGLTALFLWIGKRSTGKNGQKWVALFKDGLACVWPGKAANQFRWDEVDEVWQDFSDQYVNGMRTSHVRDCRVVTRQSKEGIVFNKNLSGIEQLTAHVHNRVTPYLLPRLGEALGSGQSLNFGKITLSDQGVTVKKDCLPWADLAGIYMESGYMVIARAAHSSSEARLRSASQGFAAFVTRISGTAQPHAPGGDAVIWKKTSINQTPNPVTLTLLVSEILQKMAPQAMA